MYKTSRSTRLLSAVLVSSLTIASCSMASEYSQPKEEKKIGWFASAMEIASPFTGAASGVAIWKALKKSSGSMKWLTLGAGVAGAIVSTYWFARLLQECEHSGPSYGDDFSDRYRDELRDYEFSQLSAPKPRVTHITNNYNCCCNKPPKVYAETPKKPVSVKTKTAEKSFGLQKPFSVGLTDFWEDPLGW